MGFRKIRALLFAAFVLGSSFCVSYPAKHAPSKITVFSRIGNALLGTSKLVLTGFVAYKMYHIFVGGVDNASKLLPRFKKGAPSAAEQAEYNSALAAAKEFPLTLICFGYMTFKLGQSAGESYGKAFQSSRSRPR